MKQYAIKGLLAVLRGLILVKRSIGPVSRAIFSPIAAVGRFLLAVVGVPAYRLFFLAKRSLQQTVGPAKHRTLFAVSNRYAIHAAAIGIVAVTSTMNAHEREVRAESFVPDSMLFSLLSNSDENAIEDVVASELPSAPVGQSPFREGLVDPNAHADMDFLDASYVTTTVGDTSLSVPTISGTAESVAPRTDVETYAIQEGDTLGQVAEHYGLSLSSLLWANNLTFRSTLKIGQVLTIPPVDGVVYTVKKGDTVSKIAQTYSSDEDKIITFNKLASADDLTIGEQIIVPDGEPPAPPPVRRVAPLTNLFTAPKSTDTPTYTGSGSAKFIWPTEWRVITQYYGHRESWGAAHTGLDVDGDYTTHSFASADGVVIYSGWKNGYGNVVEVDHGNGYVTRYAHHSKNTVKKGDLVASGEIIGVTGTTGWSSGTHLHFEIIKNGKFQNPLDYIR